MSMNRILENETVLYIIASSFGVGICSCCLIHLCRLKWREIQRNRQIKPQETLFVNPLRIKEEKILRII